MKLDFMEQLMNQINSLGLYTTCSIGLLGESESLSIMAMPGGDETVYMDGTRDKSYELQVNAKSTNQLECYDALTVIYQKLENLSELPSQNGSYDFQKFDTKSLPNLIGQDEQGYYVYAANISAKITIYKGVDTNG